MSISNAYSYVLPDHLVAQLLLYPSETVYLRVDTGPQMSFPPLAELTLHGVGVSMTESPIPLPVGDVTEFTISTQDLNRSERQR